MTFTVLALGPRAVAATAGMHGWHGLRSVVLTNFDAKRLKASDCGALLVLTDDEPRALASAADACAWTNASGIVTLTALIHRREVLDCEAWDAAARLNDSTGTAVILPVDCRAETIEALLQSYASGLTGWGNYIGFHLADLAAVAASPCIGAFGGWAGGDAAAFHARFGLAYGPPVRGALLTVRSGRDASLHRTQTIVEGVAARLPEDADLLFTTNIHEHEDRPDDSLLTVFCGHRALLR